MENTYQLKKGLTMGEMNWIEVAIKIAIDNEKKMIELNLSNGLLAYQHKKVAELYLLLDKFKIENIERVEKDVGVLY